MVTKAAVRCASLPSMRTWRALSSLLFLGMFLMPLDLPDHTPTIWLDIPELQLRMEANSAMEVPNTDFTKLRVLIGKQPSVINYGSIFSKINTEAANIIMTTASTPDGILCTFDLTRRGRFQLQPGRNSVEISFYDQGQRLYYASFLLETADENRTIAPPQDSRPEHFAGQKYAVVIGISQYKNSGDNFPNLQYADRDAAQFRDFLETPAGGGFAPQNVLYLQNDQATMQAVRTGLFTFLTRPSENDLVVIYLAGHGAPDPNDPRQLYFLTYDTDAANMGGTAFPMFDLTEVFTRILKSKRVIIFADSCHSYGISGAMQRATKKQNNLVNQYLNAYSREGSKAIITASDISQLSFEGDKWGGGHGVFTYYLLKGLRGEADINHDGVVTAGELFPWVRQQVAAATADSQTPVWFPGLAENLPLARDVEHPVAMKVPEATQAAKPAPSKKKQPPPKKPGDWLETLPK